MSRTGVSVRLVRLEVCHIWDQLFTVDTIWNIGETGDIYSESQTPFYKGN